MAFSKDQIARKLAEAHAKFESTIQAIFLLTSEREADDEPIKLLEVNSATVPSGIMPVYFGPAGDVPFPSVVIEVTPEEYADVRNNAAELPNGWKVSSQLFSR